MRAHPVSDAIPMKFDAAKFRRAKENRVSSDTWLCFVPRSGAGLFTEYRGIDLLRL
jgi:hypothetical protein